MFKPQYIVNIDFDSASKAWLQNKKRSGEGYYTYICGHLTKKGTPCNKKPMKNKNYCHIHTN